MKHLEETPWFVCDEGDTNFCAYIDTDSNYFNAEPLLKHLYPDFETFEDAKKDEILEEIALKYQKNLPRSWISKLMVLCMILQMLIIIRI